MKHLGILLIILGALALILCTFVPSLADLADNNIYTACSAGVVLVGLIVHIVLNKIFID